MTTRTRPVDARLSRGLGALWDAGAADPFFDLVVVGSGYGGSMAAATLSAPDSGLSICVLERGREYLPGEFPSQFGELPAHVRLGLQNRGTVQGSHEGLFDLRLGDDVMALVANGLGGGSLINAGVLLPPKLADFPAGSYLHTHLAALLQGGHYARALQALGGSVPLPDGTTALNTIALHPKGKQRKTQALEQLLNPGVELAPISVSMNAGANDAGIELPRCTLCGDCMTGCNIGAKNSLDANLLERAARQGVQIYTGASVLSLKRSLPGEGDRHWVLRVVHTDPRLQDRETGERFIRAHRVVLAAGTLGSPEILMRSRSDKLAFSPCLGERFSCNGDNLAAITGVKAVTGCSASERQRLDGRDIGPTITASAPLRYQPGKPRSFQVQEFSVPGALRQIYEEVVTTAQTLQQLAEGECSEHGHETRRSRDPMAVDRQAMRHTLLVGMIGHDDAAGTLHLAQPLRPTDRPPQQGGLRIAWPAAREGATLNAAHEQLIAALPIGVKLVENPIWQMLPKELASLVTQPRGPVLTVHPLGGCPMAASVREGVVDSQGLVYRAGGDAEDAWEGSLYVLDGSVFSGSLGVNPALSIAATALHAAEALLSELKISPAAPPQPAASVPRRYLAYMPIAPRPEPNRIALVERLSGPLSLHLGDTPPRTCVLELTLGYHPVRPRALMSTLRRELQVDALHPQSRVRVFDAADWEQNLRVADEATKAKAALFEARLEGHLRFLHREPSTGLQRILRSALAWLRNRGLREIYEALRSSLFDANAPAKDWPQYAKSLLNTASRAGEVRRFDYDLRVGEILHALPAGLGQIPRGGRIAGYKRLTYNCRANPWRQLTELSITHMPSMRADKAPVLKLDLRFFANQGVTLLQWLRQQDQAHALMELASFGLHLTRVLLGTHLWTFRKPDAPDDPLHEPDRLPGTVAGLAEPEITELVVDRMPDDPKQPVKIRLARYLPKRVTRSGQRPLVMIHGYSVSGNTFTHPSLDTSAVQFFCTQGREVWVVDLRTSAGLATARLPWSMEQAGVIDIPAALLHIRNVTRQPVDVLAHCIGCAMLSMALLTDPREVRSSKVQLGVDTWLTTEQLGILAAFNGSEPDPLQHPTVARVVLSQKGPVLRYTDANVLRAYVLQTLRRWLLNDDYEFRPPRQPGLASQLLDRLLASLPYPDADYDVENPRLPWIRTPWVATRHRMDALYGRDFNAANLRPATLAAIDDLFGPMHPDTLAQTLHFARFHCITNQRGRGEFVTLRRLRERWGAIPTLALHGYDNGLVDRSTQDLLDTHLTAACVPIRVLPSTGAPYRLLGHQDVLIGKDAKAVFEDIEAFLNEAGTAPVPTPEPEPTVHVAIWPWIGPRIDLPDEAQEPVRIACMPRPDQGRARLCLLPVKLVMGVPQLVIDPQAVVLSAEGDSRDWLFATPACGADDEAEHGYLAVLLYEIGEIGVNTAMPEWPILTASLNAAPDLANVVPWLKAQDSKDLERCFVSCRMLGQTARLHAAETPCSKLCFALASCQYPAGLLDEPIAQASLSAMAREAENELQLAIFCGDQIYADASAGLADASRRDERYDLPHEIALRASGMRAVLRCLPTRMLLDDHEISDNWEPLPKAVAHKRPSDDDANKALRDNGYTAWLKYQRMRHGRPHSRPGDHHWDFGGYGFYFADTRLGRSARGSHVTEAEQRILDAQQMTRLQNWLKAQKQRVKFVITPSLLLPRRLATVQDPSAAARSDAWDGFPGSLAELLSFIATHQIHNTVFLSGDEHHSLVAEAWLQLPGYSTVKIVSVHSSALYAPYPFANGNAAQLCWDDRFELSGLKVGVRAETFGAGDGFVALGIKHQAQGVGLALEFRSAHAMPATRWLALADPPGY